MTWGVFPGREVLQPTVIDPDAFMVWKEECFALWLRHWAEIYDESTTASDVIHEIYNT